MVRNTIAVQTGLDPTSASMDFRWSIGTDGTPASFFAEDGARWFWPGHGVRIDDRVIVFLLAMQSTGTGGVFSFDHAGTRVAILENVDANVGAWTVRTIDLPSLSFDAMLACAVVVEGDHLVGVAVRNAGVHVGYLVRWPLASVAADDFSTPELYDGGAWTNTVDGAPDEVIDDAGSECSLHYDSARRQWIHVASRGFDDTTIAVRTADRLEGPWSGPTDVYRPGDTDIENVFVYAAKAHLELEAGGALAVTYATNSFDFWSLFTQTELYYPHFVRVELPAR
jgi:hypothetical protein